MTRVSDTSQLSSPNDIPTILALSVAPAESGKLEEKFVTKNPSSKRWFVLAIIIGSIVIVGVGGFGTVGLLQSYGIISLPHSAASAFNIGLIPLWIMTASGGVVGGGLIGFSALKIHKIRVEEETADSKNTKGKDKTQDETLTKTEDSQSEDKSDGASKNTKDRDKVQDETLTKTEDSQSEDESDEASKNTKDKDKVQDETLTKTEDSQSEEDKIKLPPAFGDNFTKLKFSVERYKDMTAGTYMLQVFRKTTKDGQKVIEKRDDRYFLIINHNQTFLCTRRITMLQYKELIKELESRNFTLSSIELT